MHMYHPGYTSTTHPYTYRLNPPDNSANGCCACDLVSVNRGHCALC